MTTKGIKILFILAAAAFLWALIAIVVLLVAQ
jgi:hypothetical protein